MVWIMLMIVVSVSLDILLYLFSGLKEPGGKMGKGSLKIGQPGFLEVLVGIEGFRGYRGFRGCKGALDIRGSISPPARTASCGAFTPHRTSS
jgi:hypothetical protein